MSENTATPLGAGAESAPPAAESTAARRVTTHLAKLAYLAGPLLALGLGAVFLGSRPLTTDEADSVNAATGSFGDVLDRALNHDPARAGYLALLHPIVAIGDGERTVRMPSIIAAAVAALLVYFIGTKLVDRLAGLVASLGLATAGSIVAVSQQARPYTLALAAVTLSTLLFVVALQRPRPAFWALYALGSALLPLTHPAASSAVIAQVGALLLISPKPPLRYAVPALAFVAVENLLLLVAFGLDRRDAPDTPLTLAGLLGGVIRGGGWNPVLAALAVWGVVALAMRLVPHGEPWKAVLVGGLALVPVLGVVIGSLALPVLPQNALVIGAPGVALAAGTGVSALRLPMYRWITIGALVVVGLSATIAWYAVAPVQNWRAAAAYVSHAAGPGETIVVVPERSRAALRYYAPQADLSRQARGSGAWVLVAGSSGDALEAARSVVPTPTYALLKQVRFGDGLVAQHWVRP